MSSSNPPPSSNVPVSMGPGAQPVRPGEPSKSLLQEIIDIRSNYSIHVDNTAINLSYRLNDQQRSYRLPFDNIPLYGFARFSTFGGPSTSRTSGTLLIDMIRALENVTGRAVTQQEAEGIALYTSKRNMYTLYGNLSGLGIGYYLAWRRRREMKFPFMQPKAPERYENFPNRYTPILRGQYARIMWQITRFNVYAALGLFALAPFARSMGDVSMTVGLYRDPRTHDLVQSVKARGNLDRLKSNRAQSGVPPIPQENSGNSPPEAEGEGQRFYGGESYGSQQDYMSDTGFTDGSTDMDDGQESKKPISGMLGKSQVRGPPSPPSSQPQSQSSSGDFFFDDASPTAGNDPDMATSGSVPGKPSGSAWDRIRRGGLQRSSQQSGRRLQIPPEDLSKDAENSGNSFSFSKEQEERQLARDQAQKEFDAMIDRERREGGSAEYAKGMKATEAGFESPQSTGNAWERRRRG